MLVNKPPTSKIFMPSCKLLDLQQKVKF